MELHRATDEEESYFVSMTDMMVGVLFIFIILLMYFALQLREETREIKDYQETSNEARAEILRELQDELEKVGVTVTIDERNGILRLPEKILFASGQPSLSESGRFAVDKLAFVLENTLKCRASHAQWTEADCEKGGHRVETIFVEGHTDGDQIRNSEFGNWELSADRATNTFSALTQSSTALKEMKNGSGQPIFSVAGYADTRPVSLGVVEQNSLLDARIEPLRTEQDARDRLARISTIGLTDIELSEQRAALMRFLNEAKAANRRIDIRIIMERPDLPDSMDRPAKLTTK